MASCPQSHLELTLRLDAEVRAYLGKCFGDRQLEAILRTLPRPADSTALRVNTMMCDRATLLRALRASLDEHNASLAASGRRTLVARAHPLLPDGVVIASSPGGKLFWDPAAEANVFVMGIRGASAGIRQGQRVSVTVDMQAAGSAHRATVGSDAALFTGPKVYIGHGVALLSRADMFRFESGAAVRMTDCLSGFAPPMNGVLPGRLFTQNVCSMVVAHVLQPQPGETIIDMCAAPGGKSTHIAALMRGEGVLVSCDRSRNKVKRLAATCRTLGLHHVRCHVLDSTHAVLRPASSSVGGGRGSSGVAANGGTAGASSSPSSPSVPATAAHATAASSTRTAAARPCATVPTTVAEVLAQAAREEDALKRLAGFPPESFDRVLLDPPCSALGLRPRLALDYFDMAALRGHRDFGRKFMWCAVQLLRPGGVLVFSTCTINPMENEGMVRHVLDTYPCMRLTPADTPRLGLAGLPGVGLSDAERQMVQRFDPSVRSAAGDDVPGFFVARFRKVHSAAHSATYRAATALRGSAAPAAPDLCATAAVGANASAANASAAVAACASTRRGASNGTASGGARVTDRGKRSPAAPPAKTPGRQQTANGTTRRKKKAEASRLAKLGFRRYMKDAAVRQRVCDAQRHDPDFGAKDMMRLMGEQWRGMDAAARAPFKAAAAKADATPSRPKIPHSHGRRRGPAPAPPPWVAARSSIRGTAAALAAEPAPPLPLAVAPSQRAAARAGMGTASSPAFLAYARAYASAILGMQRGGAAEPWLAMLAPSFRKRWFTRRGRPCSCAAGEVVRWHAQHGVCVHRYEVGTLRVEDGGSHASAVLHGLCEFGDTRWPDCRLDVGAAWDARSGEWRVEEQTVHRVGPHSTPQLWRATHRELVSNSQIGQDVWALGRLGAAARHSRGRCFFLDIGCAHTRELSNTWLLETACGWRGIAVDPFPRGDWAAERPGTRCVAVAVALSDGSAERARGAHGGGECGGEGDADGSLAFVAPGHVLGGALSHVDMRRLRREVPAAERTVVTVPTRSLRCLLSMGRAPSTIDFVSIDVEGAELAVLRGFPFDTHTMLTCAVEHNGAEPRRTQVRELLEAHGMVLDASIEHDDLFVARSVLEAAQGGGLAVGHDR